jgi:hypothetical protein
VRFEPSSATAARVLQLGRRFAATSVSEFFAHRKGRHRPDPITKLCEGVVVPGFRAVLPPPAGNWTIIGGDFPTYQQAVASACGTAALSPQFAYRGCYRDNANRDINDFSFEQGNVTNEVCVQTCSSKGMSVAATQYGSFCFCGHTYGTLGAADNCNMPCAGNNGEICGGPWANTVFSR